MTNTDTNNGLSKRATDEPSHKSIHRSAYDYDVNAILGVAVFSLDGLPQEYFITPEKRDTAWTQLILQSLGLQELTAEALGLQSFKHEYTIVQTREGDAVIVRTAECFLALFMKRSRPQPIPRVETEWVDWVCQFEATSLRSHPHFRAV